MNDIPWKFSSIGQLAILLEASSPKPGNVSRLKRFSDTGYRHFLASAASIGRGIYNSSQRGIRLARNELEPSEVQLGFLIYECGKDIFTGLNKKNTLLGTILLHVPLTVALSALISDEEKFSPKGAKGWMKIILNGTTNDDAIDLYRAFHLLEKHSGELNKQSGSWDDIHDRYDISNPNVYTNLREDGINLLGLFQIASNVDTIASEWADYFHLTFTKSYPYLKKQSTGLADLEEATVRTFIWLLSIQVDGLIVKKAGIEKAEEIRLHAEKIIDSDFKEEDIKILDQILRVDGNIFNPGSTADLVSAALVCRLTELHFGEG